MRSTLLVVLATMCAGLVAAPVPQAGGNHQASTGIPMTDSAGLLQYAGQRVTLCGKVASVADRPGGSVLLALYGASDKLYAAADKASASLLVPGSAATATGYVQKPVCATGDEQATSDGPTVIVS